MAIESIGAGSALSYQSSTSEMVVKPVQQVKDAEVEQSNVANSIAKETTDLKVNSNDNYSNQNQSFQEQTEEKQRDAIKKSIEELNKNINKNTEAQFGYHDETNRVTIKIVDKETKEVIREVPPEKTLDMIAKVWELAGMIVDEKR